MQSEQEIILPTIALKGKPLSFRGNKLTQRYLSCFSFHVFFNVHMFLFFVIRGFEILGMFFPSFQH